MYFEDLTVYKYNLPFEISTVLNVGWLDAVHSFPLGRVDADVLAKLKHVAVFNSVNPMRGAHTCQHCKRKSIRITSGGKTKNIGCAEIWVPSHDRKLIFAAPDLVTHYIEAHQYFPPQVFLDAVIKLDESDPSWNGEREYERLIEMHYRRD